MFALLIASLMFFKFFLQNLCPISYVEISDKCLVYKPANGSIAQMSP